MHWEGKQLFIDDEDQCYRCVYHQRSLCPLIGAVQTGATFMEDDHLTIAECPMFKEVHLHIAGTEGRSAEVVEFNPDLKSS